MDASPPKSRRSDEKSERAAVRPDGTPTMPLRACILFVLLLAAARGACAQSSVATARMTGRVSGAVMLSASEPPALNDRTRVSTANVDAATVAVSLSGSAGEETRVRIPLRLRSNVGYSLRASFHSQSDQAVRLSVADVKATGNLVHANAVEGVSLGDALAATPDGRAAFLTIQNTTPLALLAGPPVSKGGTFSSPDNAIEIVLSIELRPRADGQPWSTQLTISAAPNPHAGR
jgi:hypothetical protein